MLPETFSLRRAAVAYVFPGRLELRREDNLAFYDRVTAQGVDVPQFQQEPTLLKLVRPASPKGMFQIEVGHYKQNFRFLVAEVWPTKPMKILAESADIAWDCFQETWPANRLGGARASFVETSLRLSAAAEGGNATTFLADRALRISHEALAKLGRGLNGIGLTLMLPVDLTPGPDASLGGAQVTIRIETLLDDPSCLFLEIVAKWPSISVPPEIRQQSGAADFLNPEVFAPSAYLNQTYDFVTQQAADFLNKAAGGH